MVTSDSHSIYLIDNNPLLVKISISTYNNMYACIGLCFFNKASQLAHTICISCISLRFLNNEFQLDYTIYIPFLIGLRLFYDAYQFQFANASTIPFKFSISSLLKWPAGSIYHAYRVHTHKIKTSCRVNYYLSALEVHFSCGNA